MDNTSLPNQPIIEPEATKTTQKIKKPQLIVLISGLSVLLIILTVLFVKGFFVAAMVNGRPISRFAVIEELEKQGGKQALESLIDKKLIENELDKQDIRVSKEEVDEKIKNIEAQIALQGETLQGVLREQGMTEEKFREQITMQKKLEKILADKVTVSPEEIDAFLQESKVTPPKDLRVEDFRKQVSEQIQQQKMQQEAGKWVASLTQAAKIKYYVNY